MGHCVSQSVSQSVYIYQSINWNDDLEGDAYCPLITEAPLEGGTSPLITVSPMEEDTSPFGRGC